MKHTPRKVAEYVALTAAAPDLLEALLRIVETVNRKDCQFCADLGWYGPEHSVGCPISQAQDAITKAKGGLWTIKR